MKNIIINLTSSQILEKIGTCLNMLGFFQRTNKDTATKLNPKYILEIFHYQTKIRALIQKNK